MLHNRIWLVALLALAICSIETGLRLGADSPDTRFTLPRFSLGYFWDTPLGWTGLVDGTPVNRDGMELDSLAAFFRDDPDLPVALGDNVYVRFAGYSLVGSAFAPLIGDYESFVVVNVLFWTAAVLATYALAKRLTESELIALLAALLVSTAPAFEALAGQPLPYVASYSLFVVGLLFLERVRLFEKDTSPTVALACGFVCGLGFVFYDLWMLPAFVVVYGFFRRAPVQNLVLALVAMAAPRLVWSGYWQLLHLPSYSQNETHPLEALAAWLDLLRNGLSIAGLKALAALAAHGLLNIATAFLFWPLLLATWELWQRRHSTEAQWFVAVAIAGFAPALFMLSTWPHIPRWYAYGFPAVYILAAAGAVRLGRMLDIMLPTRVSAPHPPPFSMGNQASHGASHAASREVILAAIALFALLPAVVLANVDLVGATRPMELLLFQPEHWSYLWSA